MNYTFASDNTAGIAPEALAALAAANADAAPSYGDDAFSARARRLIGEVFETDVQVSFVFNGTASNALALTHCRRSFESIICHEFAHVDTDECSAPEYFSGGSKVVTVGGALGKIDPAALEGALTRGHGVHYPKPGVLSLTQATEWGTLYTPAEIARLAEIARAKGMPVHLDGARFANAVATLQSRGISAADITWRAGVDVLSFGGTKNGMLSTETVVFFNRGLAAEFEYRVKQGGQLASKQRFAAAQWCAMLGDGAWLKHARHANEAARKIAAGLGKLPGARLLAEPEANGVFVVLPLATAEKLRAKGWQFHPFIGDDGYRFMGSWATRDDDIERLLADAG